MRDIKLLRLLIYYDHDPSFLLPQPSNKVIRGILPSCARSFLFNELLLLVQFKNEIISNCYPMQLSKLIYDYTESFDCAIFIVANMHWKGCFHLSLNCLDYSYSSK
jgi:hypothetical protein